jgi:hypothetical protein
MPLLIQGINEIEASNIVFSLQTNTDGKSCYVLSLTPVSDSGVQIDGSSMIRPTSYIAGDLACLSYFMGKSNFSSTWCNWCQVAASGWQTYLNTDDDMLWDIGPVNQQVAINNENKYTDERRMGVRSSPLFSIPFIRILFSVLHAMP